ncbi:MAG: peptidase S9 [Bacteroidota bacterium]
MSAFLAARLGARLGASLRSLLLVLLAAACTLPVVPTAEAQYFGRNKVQYDDFDFQVLETEHFDIYYYGDMEQAARDAARMAERWYTRLSRILEHEFDERKTIIFYADDADFRQTNVIGGIISDGVAGVTEGLKQRIVMPFGASYAQTDHVLGHELVHQFQYDIAQRGGSFGNFVRMPLWVVEGFAEYLSVGREDAHTTMWMRDAVVRDNFPTLQQLSSDPRFFPYRYGQAFWAFVGGTYGDEAASDLFKRGLSMPFDSALVSITGLGPDEFSERWAEQVAEAYLPVAADRAIPYGPALAALDPERYPRLDSLQLADAPGTRTLARDIDAGDTNVSPVLSPDGRYVAFLSERDLFGIDLYLGDAQTGEVIKKLESVGTSAHFDALRFISSAGTWSPDGTRFAYVVFAEGDNEIAVLDVASRNVVQRLKVDGVTAIKDPAWGPDGETIAFTGRKGGVSNLYTVTVDGGQARQLTNDRYTELQAQWSPDGRTLVYATDEVPETSFERLRFGPMRLALLDVESGEQTLLPHFDGAKHINPQWSPDGRSIYFISNPDGVSNVFRYALGSRVTGDPAQDDGVTDGTVYRVTNLVSGVSGITFLSPALTVAQQTGRVMYSAFEAQGYSVYTVEADDAQGEPFAHEDSDAAATPLAALLVPTGAQNRSKVDGYLADVLDGLPDTREFPSRSYSPKLTLDYVSQPSVGIGYNSGLGGLGVGGGIFMLFTDQLGNHQLGITALANGTLKDIGGQVQYINQGNRLNYGAVLSHIPYLRLGFGSDDDLPVLTRFYERIYYSQAGLLSSYPLSTTRRFQMSTGYTRIGRDIEFDDVRLDGSVRRRDATAAFGLAEFDALHLGQLGGAYVGDYSFFGFTGPVRGGRYFFGAEGTAGSLTFGTLTADFRRYFYLPSLQSTFAVRGLGQGRFGNDAGDGSLRPYFLGFDFRYGPLVRGYSFGSFDDTNEYLALQDRLFGNRFVSTSAELRVPLLGTSDFGLLNFPFLPTTLVLFGDMGVVWGQQTLTSATSSQTLGVEFADINPLFSAGISTRVNVLGALILEPYFALPFSRDDRQTVWGLSFLPGW